MIENAKYKSAGGHTFSKTILFMFIVYYIIL
jgi:hypothetical protein